MPRPLFRLPPQLPVEHMKTYGIFAPLETHFRDGTCEEAGCLAWRAGWQTIVDETAELGQRQARYIRKQARRSFTESRSPVGTVFDFHPGQRCFRAPHRIRIERPEIFVVRGGDWRGNPRGDRRVHVSADDWVDDFANHQDGIAQRVQRG